MCGLTQGLGALNQARQHGVNNVTRVSLTCFIHERHSLTSGDSIDKVFSGSKENKDVFLGASMDGFYGGPENPWSIEASRARAPPVHE